MEIEYQNKYVVTWCLDRKEGPRICLRAITAENQQRTIEIKSEGFNLELEDIEARDFLNILNQITVSTPFAPDLGVAAEQVSTSYLEEPIIPEVSPPPEKSEIAEVTPIVEPTVPDSSEIIQVLKESERTYAEITPSSPDDVSPKVEEHKLPIISESVKEIIEEETISPESPSHHEEPEVISPEIETASFFQQSVTKSPLEMILEEDEGRNVENVPEVSPISEPEELHEAPATTSYTPEDLQTEAFFSQFDTKRTAELSQTPEPNLEPEPEPKSELEYKRVVQLEPTPKFEKKEHIKTEAERRAEVEKERAERRRRLWELTRGF
ncbi:MAG: hypothetical protein ACFFC6_06870 [Promethearchaeota archaeon]